MAKYRTTSTIYTTNWLKRKSSKKTARKKLGPTPNRQCASFAYGASQAANIKEMKMSGWVTLASLAKKINKLNGK